LAFTARDHGSWEVYVMPAMGGLARRLTYQGESAVVVGWSPDNQYIYFTTSYKQAFRRAQRLWQVHVDGGVPTVLPFGIANRISHQPAGTGVVLGRHSADAARWKRYRGGTIGQLWIDNSGDGEFAQLMPAEGNLSSPNWLDDRIYFLSDHEGIGNLYSCLSDGSGLKRHTHHDDYYARGAQSDGTRIVYHAGGDMYFYDPANDLNDRIDVELYSPKIQAQRKYVQPVKYLQGIALHPQGHTMSVTARGKCFTLANWEGAVTQHGDPDGVRYRLTQWLNDGKRLVLVSDAGGEEALEIHAVDGETLPQRFDNLDLGRPTSLCVSPTKDQLLLSNHRFELHYVDLEAGTSNLLDKSDYARIRGMSWSPDGRWAAYACAETGETVSIKIVELASGQVHLVTIPEFNDYQPVWDPEGKYLYFLSARVFNPVYDAVHFELGFPRAVRPMLVTLRKDIPNPFVPRPHQVEKPGDNEEEKKTPPGHEQRTEDDRPGDESLQASGTAAAAAGDNDDTPKADSDTNANEKNPEPVNIDFEGIQERVIAFPRDEGRYGQIAAIKDKVMYTLFPVEGALQSRWDKEDSPQGVLLAYDFKQLKEENLANGVEYVTVSRDNTTMAYLSNKVIRVVKAGEKAPETSPNGNKSQDGGRSTGVVNLERIRLSVVPQIEWRQMYREAWRLQRDHFWSENMSGVDWEQVYQRYLPLLERIATRSEFSDLMWEMQGELGTSHAYEIGGDYRIAPPWRQGHLGAEYVYDEAVGGYRITHMVQGDSWETEGHSPLLLPGVDINTGDVICAIGGRTLDVQYGPEQALENLGGQEVEITVSRADNKDVVESSAYTKQRFTIKTLGDERKAYYREWVNTKRRMVHEATENQVGYLHIPDMMATGFAEFHRGWLAELKHAGLIIDVRYNGGGHVSQLILEKLARRRIGYDITRWGRPESYPMYAVLGPMVAITNENAGSDGDIFSHSFKLMKLGTLVGKRTWGGVIGISPTQPLADGSITTQPEYSFWFEDVGWDVENFGTEPDVEVDITPQDYREGRDPQLEKALEIIKGELVEHPPVMPDFSKRPHLPLPKLPDIS